MTYYKVGKRVEPSNTHHALVIPPLVIVLVSCFLFVLVQPHHKITAPAASSLSSPTQNQPQQTLPMAQNTALPLIDPVVVEKSTSSIAGDIVTATPQPNATASSSLQSAVTNNQQPTVTISVPTRIESKKSTPSTIKNTYGSKKFNSGRH